MCGWFCFCFFNLVAFSVSAFSPHQHSARGCDDWNRNRGVLQLAHITRMEMLIDALFSLVGSVETERGENSKYLREVIEEQDQS